MHSSRPYRFLLHGLCLVAVAVAPAACGRTDTARAADEGADGAAPATTQDAAAGQDAANPVSSSLRQIMAREAKNMVQAAKDMPADKYGFQPTEGMMTYGHLIKHVAGSNDYLCGKISGMEPPKRADVSDSDKDGLVQAIQSSFDFCGKALASVDDSKLEESVPFFGGQQVPRAMAMIDLAADWADHYGHQATYLRLNGILPPSARKGSE